MFSEPGQQANPLTVKGREDTRGIARGTDDEERHFQETTTKPSRVTVPKPTQVDGKKILRRARELTLRNSAN